LVEHGAETPDSLQLTPWQRSRGVGNHLISVILNPAVGTAWHRRVGEQYNPQ
jgi:hypothetical protein